MSFRYCKKKSSAFSHPRLPRLAWFVLLAKCFEQTLSIWTFIMPIFLSTHIPSALLHHIFCDILPPTIFALHHHHHTEKYCFSVTFFFLLCLLSSVVHVRLSSVILKWWWWVFLSATTHIIDVNMKEFSSWRFSFEKNQSEHCIEWIFDDVMEERNQICFNFHHFF